MRYPSLFFPSRILCFCCRKPLYWVCNYLKHHSCIILDLQYRERVIFIGQEIDEELSNQILATMLYLDSLDSSKMLYLYINGPGGDVSTCSSWIFLSSLFYSVSLWWKFLLLQLTPCMAVYDTMQSLKSPVGTHCVGYAYNLSGFLLAAGDKVCDCHKLYASFQYPLLSLVINIMGLKLIKWCIVSFLIPNN